MSTSDRALRFVNLLPLPARARSGSKPALTSGQTSIADGVAPPTAIRSDQEQRVMDSRRAEALRGFFPKVFTWFASRWDLDGMSEVNHYLSQASDSADLERRIRHLEQRRHFRG